MLPIYLIIMINFALRIYSYSKSITSGTALFKLGTSALNLANWKIPFVDLPR